MSVFVSRAVSPGSSQDRADVFARGEAAVLVVAGGVAAELVLDRVREAALDVDFDLLAPARWGRLLEETGPAVKRVGESTVAIVALVPGRLVHASAGNSEAWLVGPSDVVKLTETTPRLGSGREAPHAGARALGATWEGRLVVASDGLFRHVAEAALLRVVRTEKFGRVGDALVELAGARGVAVLVAER